MRIYQTFYKWYQSLFLTGLEKIDPSLLSVLQKGTWNLLSIHFSIKTHNNGWTILGSTSRFSFSTFLFSWCDGASDWHKLCPRGSVDLKQVLHFCAATSCKRGWKSVTWLQLSVWPRGSRCFVSDLPSQTDRGTFQLEIAPSWCQRGNACLDRGLSCMRSRQQPVLKPHRNLGWSMLTQLCVCVCTYETLCKCTTQWQSTLFFCE